ncbi:MAG: type II toxin-antitoxin system VapC family toxin [Bryobacterales bacterium]|nr:type II toxin-antitoxin system VapC family toxin [Bryobacterales bacterium]
MPRAVIDASAILAVLLREPGSDVVETYYAQGIVSAVNLSEVAAKLCDLGMGAAEARDLLSALGLEIRAFDETQALAAGALREVTRSRGLSLGDRACLALGIAEGVPVVTTDRNWEAVSTQARAEVVVIR